MATKPTYNVNGTPGLARTVVSRTSGTRLNIWYSPEAKSIKTNDAKPWVVECEDHKARKECVTRTEARLHREDPASFCRTCNTASKKANGTGTATGKVKATKAPAKKAAPAKTTASKKAPAKKAA